MNNFLNRTKGLIGVNNLQKLADANIAVVGIGGVGSFCAEALVRAGVGSITVIDFDVVDITNINRQLIADHETIGLLKVNVFADRALKINPKINITTLPVFFDANLNLDLKQFDYVADCIDSVKAKLSLIELAIKYNVSVISAMGAGNKLNPLKFKISDISKTNTCPLARIIRLELRKRGINHLKVCWSDELPVVADETQKFPNSISFVPSVAGLLIASEIVNDIIKR